MDEKEKEYIFEIITLLNTLTKTQILEKRLKGKKVQLIIRGCVMCM